MGDGWETRRRRVPGNDFIIIELGKPGHISNVELDTCHFKGNFPDRASIQTIDLRNEKDKLKAFETSSDWEFFLGEKKCKADSIHNFGKDDFLHEKKVSHVRLNIYPDGGVSRFRIFDNIDAGNPSSISTRAIASPPASRRPRWKVAILMPCLLQRLPRSPIKPGLS